MDENLASFLCSASFYSVNSHQLLNLQGESTVKGNEFARENLASIGGEK